MNMSRQMLESLGYTVLTASTPMEAIQLAETYSDRIDLLITDVVLPEMSGRILVERLRSINPDLKYIYMSGYTANAIAHQGVLEEGVHFIPKPFSIKDIADKVRNVLDHKV